MCYLQMRYLDYVARRALWQAGLNYGHGTGHGVGAYLLVHEYPPVINSASDKILHKNMFTSNGKFSFFALNLKPQIYFPLLHFFVLFPQTIMWKPYICCTIISIPNQSRTWLL